MKKVELNPKVSIIMSTYKTPINFLKLSIESILNQTFDEFEFIIICDGDKEEYDFIKNNYSYDKRIVLLYHIRNMGLAKSLNDGIAKSRGKYIARMDSDDISYPNRIDVQYRFMEKNKNIFLCSTFAKTFGKISITKGVFFNTPKEIDIQLLYNNCIIHPTVFFRKNIFIEKNYNYNESFICSQDYELWSRISNNNFYVIPRCLLKLRIHENQISIKKGELQIKLRHDVFNDNLLKYNISDDYFDLLEMLNGEIEINSNNYLLFAKKIKCFMRLKINFDYNTLKKVLYNRFLEILISQRKFSVLFKIIISIKHTQIILNFTNFKYILWKIFK